VLPDAEAEVIRAVFLALAKKYHPDSSGNAESGGKFKEINAAYEILNNPEKRKEYDATRPEQSNTTGQYEPDIDDEDLFVADRQKGMEAFNAGDYATALRELRPLAEQGYVDAQVNLGFMYDKGEGVAQDDAQAAAWFRKAADQGDAKAQFNLGNKYRRGEGVAQDYSQAMAWYRKAADQGDADALFNLGFMYAKGQGVTRDYLQGHEWIFKAAAQGHAEAQSMVPTLGLKVSNELIQNFNKLHKKSKLKEFIKRYLNKD
jgi:TPR repeat protein